MKRWSSIAGSFAIPVLFASALNAQSNGIGVESRKLANGLEVLVIGNHAVPLVTIELNVRNGAYTEGPQFSGLSHLYEHMFFKANKTIPSQEMYLKRVNQLGAVSSTRAPLLDTDRGDGRVVDCDHSRRTRRVAQAANDEGKSDHRRGRQRFA